MAKARIENIFQRYEKKFLMTREQFLYWNQVLEEQFQLDEYGQYTVASTYYDTPGFQVIQQSLDKPSFREKLRLRSYGATEDKDTVYLELKKKVRGVSYKRRAPLTLAEAEKYMSQRVIPRESNQILREVDWYLSQYAVEAKAIISYERTAFVQTSDPALRLTIDKNIRWRRENLSLSQGSYGAPLLADERYLMEIKASESLPAWLCRALSAGKIYPTSFSKYGKVYEQYLHLQATSQKTKSSIPCFSIQWTA